MPPSAAATTEPAASKSATPASTEAHTEPSARNRVHISRHSESCAKASGPACHRAHSPRSSSVSPWHGGILLSFFFSLLLADHGSATLRTFLLITGDPPFMRLSVAALRANARAAGAGTKTATHSPAARPASSCSPSASTRTLPSSAAASSSFSVHRRFLLYPRLCCIRHSETSAPCPLAFLRARKVPGGHGRPCCVQPVGKAQEKKR